MYLAPPLSAWVRITQGESLSRWPAPHHTTHLKILALFPELISTPPDARENLISKEFEGKNFKENSVTHKPLQTGDVAPPGGAITVQGFFLVFSVAQEVHTYTPPQSCLFQGR